MAKKPTQGAAPSTAIATIRTSQGGNGLQKIDLTGNGPIPNLDNFDVTPIDLTTEYWTPEKPGECKRLIFQKIADRDFTDEKTGEVKPLPTAFFLGKDGDSVRVITNSSKRLVAALENANVESGTPLLITFIENKKNSKNDNKSDRWSIKPLQINITAKSESAA